MIVPEGFVPLTKTSPIFKGDEKLPAASLKYAVKLPLKEPVDEYATCPVALRLELIQNGGDDNEPVVTEFTNGQILTGDVLFLGVAAALTKSVALLSVSVQPLLDLLTLLELLMAAGAGAAPSQQLAVIPYPIKSIMADTDGQLPVKVTELLTSASFPAVADISVLAITRSGMGRAAPEVPVVVI